MLDITNKQKYDISVSWRDSDRGGTIQGIDAVCMLRGNIKVDFK